MAGTVHPSAPPAGPVRTVLRNLWGTFRFAPWPVKVMLLLIFVGGPLAVGLRYGRSRVRAIRLGSQVAEWKKFEDAVRAGDEAKMTAALDQVLVLVPGDATALGRKRAIETGEADPADQPMVALSYRRHLRAGRLAEAEREARKRLDAEKADWLARCVVAAALLQRGDKPAAAAELAQLPSPGNPAARVDPGGLLFAFRLFRATDSDPTPLRTFVQGVILPLVKAPNAAQLPAAEKVSLLECYVEGFEPGRDRPQPAALAEAWAPAARLADAAADEATEATEAAALVRLGRLTPRFDDGLAALRRGDQVTEAEFAHLQGDLRGRGRRVWEAVLAADPKNAEAYRGLGTVLLRAWDATPPADRPALYQQARDVLVRGLEARDDDPELAQLFARLMAAEGQPLRAAEFLIGQAHRHPDKPVWWALAAEAAVAANRREVALEACAKLRQKDPDNLYAVRTEARLWIEAGEPARALSVLARLGQPALARDANAAYSYTRALAETGAADALAGFVTAVAAADPPTAVGAAARGLADAAGLPADELTARLAVLAERHPGHPDLLKTRAEAAYRAAEAGDPIWQVGRVAAAARAVEQALAKLPDDPGLAVRLGWLRLRGENNLPQAVRAVAGLGTLTAPTPAQSELLGAVALAEGKLPAAVTHLERATSAADAPAGAYALLARAYHATGRPGPANQALQAARHRPRTSPREQAEYLAAAKLIVQ